MKHIPPDRQQAYWDEQEVKFVKGNLIWKACERAVYHHPEIIDPDQPTDYPLGRYQRMLDFYYAVQGTIGMPRKINRNVGRRNASLPFSPDNLIYQK